jgi:site-specific DNA recombinase
MYPEKLSFDGEHLRTTRINEALRIIYTLDKAFGENKNRTKGKFSNLSCQVDLARQNSNLIMTDLKQLSALSQ